MTPPPTARGLEQAREALADLMEWFTPEAQHRVVAGHFDRAREEGRAEERAAVVAVGVVRDDGV